MIERVNVLPTRVWIENGIGGERYVVMQHEGHEPFDYAVIGYNWKYTCNSSTHDEAVRLAVSLGAQEPVEFRSRMPIGLALDDSTKFQARVHSWLQACFGSLIAGDRKERSHRFVEEALELAQASGCSADEAYQLVDYVFARPIGEQEQEVGGVMLTLAALCLANGIDMHAAGEKELARVWAKIDAIRKKQAAAPKHSPLPQAATVASAGPWLRVENQLPELREAPYLVLTIASKVYPEASSFAGEGVRRVHQDWVVRQWPQNFTHWALMAPFSAANDGCVEAERAP